MAFPAAPTESGAAKIHFLTTDGNAALGWFGVDSGTTTTGSNAVGFAAIATHVEDDGVGSPGGLSTTSVPLVLVGGGRDDALSALTPAEGDATYLRVDANGALWTHDDALDAALSGSELQVDVVAALPAGTNAIGKLAANSGVDIGDVDVLSLPSLAAGTNAIGKLAANTGVDIGDVDVTSLVPGVAATSLGKAEDAAHASGDTGVQMLAVRKATPADLSGADGDYEPLQLDNGRLWASATIDAALPAGTNAIGKLAANSGVDIGDVDVLSLPALAAGSNAIGKLAANTGVDIGDVDVTSVVPGTGATSLGKAEDAAHSSSDVGVMALAVRNDALAALGGADGDYAPLQVDEDGGLWTHPAAAPKGGCKLFTSVDLDESEEDPAAGPVTIYSIYVWNLTAAPLWLQMFNTNTVTVGTTAPTNNFMIPANADSDGAGVVLPLPVSGLAYSTALTVAITTGSGTNNGAPGAGDAGIAIAYQD